jgi:hypothetical protein
MADVALLDVHTPAALYHDRPLTPREEEEDENGELTPD